MPRLSGIFDIYIFIPKFRLRCGGFYLFCAHSKILQMCGKLSLDSNVIIELLKKVNKCAEVLSFSVILFVVLRTMSLSEEIIILFVELRSTHC